MSTPPQLGNSLPKDETYNGLLEIEKQLVDPLHGGDVRFAIVKFHTDKTIRKLATKDVYPVLAIDHFEPLTTQASVDAAEKLLEGQWVERTGKDAMPKAPAEESPTLDMPAETDADLGNDEV